MLKPLDPLNVSFALMSSLWSPKHYLEYPRSLETLKVPGRSFEVPRRSHEEPGRSLEAPERSLEVQERSLEAQ